MGRSLRRAARTQHRAPARQRRTGTREVHLLPRLLPPQLQAYYTDSVDLARPDKVERQLTEMGLLNLDEFDRIPEKKHPLLKNLMQLSALNLRKAYQRHGQALPRIASFIGTSNSRELLSDPSGSRRFICVLVEHPIDCTGIDHAQIYAQLKAELENGERYWFSHGEENALRLHNAAFYRICGRGRCCAATIVRLSRARRYARFRCPKYSHGCGDLNPGRWQA